MVGVALNSVFVLVEFGFGLFANSSALMADAGHNLSDVLGLLLAWIATVLARRSPNARFTYGLRSFSILAALANAVLLLLACGAIGVDALGRLAHPGPVNNHVVILVAAAGIAVNGGTAWLLAGSGAHDLNMRGAYLHMVADAAVSFGVVIAALVTLSTGWLWLDPMVSVAIVLFIIWGTWGLLRQSLGLALHAVPDRLELAQVQGFLQQQAGVSDVHDLHLWGMSTTESALTAHLVIPAGYPGDEAIESIAQALQSRFGINHSTLQVEQGTVAHKCSIAKAV